MRKTRSASRRSLRAVVGLGVAVASLAFAGVANAGVQVISPDVTTNNCPTTPPTTDTLSTAIANATAASNTIVLTPGVYCPVDTAPATTITISHNLNIVADHSFQATGGLPQILINGLSAQPGNGPLFTIASGVTVRFDGFNFGSAGTQGGAVIVNNGNLSIYGVDFDGNSGLDMTNNGTANVVDSSVTGSSSDGFDNFGTLTLTNDSFVGNGGSALDIEGGSTTNAFNTLFANNSATTGDCNANLFQLSNAPAPGTLDDDGTCGAQFSAQSGVDTFVGPSAAVKGTGVINTNGGPATTLSLAPNSFTTLKGISANCPTTDGRFFVNPVSGTTRECDIGAITGSCTNNPATAPCVPAANSSSQETAGPTCKVTTGGVTGVSQNVLLNDTLSGIGPEAGLQTDNPSNTIATAYPPPAAVPVPGYDVSNLQDNNGSVSFTSPTSPTTSGVVLTAGNKATAGVNNAMWSFTGLNWAGVATNCF